ncbi:MAG: LacI family DNA-binding transcriptional regulator [Phycisphaerae bacterium]|nr:LacI family DNA-binding transcriptional regulator [Phycisphaerae bacterium]
MRTAVRIKDIAQDVKLPISTVGNILRNDSRYDKDVRRRVMESAKRLGYRPNILARGLKGGRTQTVGILFPMGGVHNPGELVQGIATKVNDRHYATQIADSRYQTDIVQRNLQDYLRRGVDAVVIQVVTTMRLEEFEDLFQAFRAVVLIPDLPQKTSADQVVLCRQQAINDAVDHLIHTGRKHPMVLGPPESEILKVEPFLRRLKERGLAFERKPAIYHQSNPASTSMADVAWEALETYCSDSVPFDALLCGTDETAVAAYNWLESRGKKVPDDVAVIGFNDSSYSKFLLPALASVNRQDEEFIQQVVNMLFNRLENPDLPPQQVNIQMKFVYRTSAG